MTRIESTAQTQLHFKTRSILQAAMDALDSYYGEGVALAHRELALKLAKSTATYVAAEIIANAITEGSETIRKGLDAIGHGILYSRN
jgi:hypothetical protein